MDKLGEFIAGLQTILDSPNPPRDDLVRVIQATQRDFLSSALALSTMAWPTHTHLELVKIVIGLPIQEPPRDVVLADPTTSHEADPFFAADYFDKLRHQLLSTPVSTLADSDGSWVRNIGFSIEATIMHASRRADALEKLDETCKAEDARCGYAMGHIRAYCAHVLGSGTLATVHWESIARMVFAMFYLLPFSTKTIPALTLPASQSEPSLHPHIAKMVVHYGTWLQIVQQIVDNHGPTMCRRMPTVIADPATTQFRWGIPTVHLVATTELLRNVLMRRLLLSRAQSGARHTDAAAAAAAWASSASAISAEEQRLEKFELVVLGKIIAQDASAVYGIMTEQHRLLQVHEEYAKNHEHLAAVPGTAECLSFSLTRTCHGLAPILNYDEQALTQAMEMGRLLECMRDMKASTVNFCYGPLYGCYPPGTDSIPAYAEMLLLRMATTLYNLDQPWGSMASLLSPRRVAGISQELDARMLQVLRISSVYFDTFSLNTTEPEAGPPVEFAGLSTIMGRLIRRSFVHQPFTAAHLQDIDSTLVEPDFDRHVDLSIEWIREFVMFGRTFMPPQLLYTQTAATAERAAASLVHADRASILVDFLARLSHDQWAALAAIRFNRHIQGPPDSNSSERSAMSIVFSIARRLASMGPLPDSASDLLDTGRWQATIAMCHPEPVFLAYAIVAQCLAPARELVKVDEGGHFRPMLNQQGIRALKALEMAMTKEGASAWIECKLLLAPPIYAKTSDNGAAQFAQSQLTGALKLLSTGRLADFAYELDVPEASLGFSGQDMQLVAHFVQHYVENASSLLPLLSRTLLTAPGISTNDIAGAQTNPFSTPNVLSKVPIIEALSSPTACNIEATVSEWRRQASQLPFAESRRCIQELIASCYPSSSKHYLERVLVRYMEASPVVGVELVIGSVANFMWTTQMVYSRESNLFHEIRGMFAPVSSAPLLAVPEVDSASDDKAKELARSRNEPVFNAVVGGRVRPGNRVRSYSSSSSSSIISPASKVPITTAERGHEPSSHSNGRADNVPRAVNTARSPVACGRILLLLTALCYGRSLGNTPIYMWLTDCLDYAPVPVLQTYFDLLFVERAPTFDSSLPVEPDWRMKVIAFVTLWTKDRQLRMRPMIQTLGASLMRYILNSGGGGEQWSILWAEWSTVVNDAVCRQFSLRQTLPTLREIVDAMLLVPPRDSLMAADSHPLFKLASLLDASPVHNELAFSDSRDWFTTHVLPRIVECSADNAVARAILGQVLSSVDTLYRMVPWLDVATPPSQMESLSHGPPVALSSGAAKEHFVSYLSPLARVLLAIANYVEGGSYDAGCDDHNTDMADADDTPTSAKPTVGSPVSTEASLSGNAEDIFNWQWLDELLVVYLSGSSSDPATHTDTIDALLDVYTFSSVHGLRKSIQNVVIATCLHNSSTALAILKRVFSMRPLDIFTLHSLRPRSLSQMASVADTPDDAEPAFRPNYELHPLAKLVLNSVLGVGGEDRAAQVVALVQMCFWDMATQPDVRRQLIALNPRLVQKGGRPVVTEAKTPFDAIKSVTSGELYISAESTASASAYALDRSMCLMTLLLTRSEDSESVRQFAKALALSRIFLSTILTYVSPSMSQFAGLPTSLKLLGLLWTAVDNGEAMVGEVKAAQVWASTSFSRLARRLSDDAPEVYMTWPHVQATYLGQ
ncbi:hypothetical protein GGI20_004505 [Coemansia sp. BCRC 34301]|nr:hypothetical protein GGI20_004505 [Coemansia sp. BCRC 34301]